MSLGFNFYANIVLAFFNSMPTGRYKDFTEKKHTFILQNNKCLSVALIFSTTYSLHIR